MKVAERQVVFFIRRSTTNLFFNISSTSSDDRRMTRGLGKFSGGAPNSLGFGGLAPIILRKFRELRLYLVLDLSYAG